ncbi:MAG: aldo/keto reductase [Methylacidiphilales bacterium]|nr:aldo/keto reductase [Candidatus Methylacidiphilales bacterium]
MKYSFLGKSDIKVSKICLGTMVFGEQVDYQESEKIMDYAITHEVNFFDVAEVYPVPPKAETYGRSEEFVGKFLQEHGNRHSVVVATKVAGPSLSGPGRGFNWIRGGARLSADHIQRAIDSSLKRLRTDYIDLYQLHWPERKVNIFGAMDYTHVEELGIPLEESLDALERAKQAGKIRLYGVSNETSWGVMQSARISALHGWQGISTIQNPYNLLNRVFDIQLAEVCLREKISLLAYSPLAFGVLSGKYLSGEKNTAWRLFHPSFTAFGNAYTRYSQPHVLEAIREYKKLANENNMSLTTLALAFINERPYLGGTIIGATTLEQVMENISSIDIALTSEIRTALQILHEKYRNPCP